MRRVFLALTLCLALGGTRLGAQAAPPSSVLLFVDSLHIAFNQTPAIRRSLTRAIGRLLDSGRSVGVVTDDSPGADVFMIRPTTERSELVQFSDRMKGAALRPDEIANPTPAIAGEMAFRDRMARDTVREAIAQVQPGAVIYISGAEVQPAGLSIPVFVTTPNEIDAALDRLLAGVPVPGSAVRTDQR